MSKFRVNGDGFGSYAYIRTNCGGAIHQYKVVSRVASNYYCDVPIMWDSKPYIHDRLVNVVNVIHCGVQEDKVLPVAEDECEEIEGLQDKKGMGRDAVYAMCLAEYGIQSQVDMAIEEMSELIKALMKWRRRMREAESTGKYLSTEMVAARKAIVDELADVKIMCRQMELAFGAEEETEERIDFKTERQMNRLHEKSKSV